MAKDTRNQKISINDVKNQEDVKRLLRSLEMAKNKNTSSKKNNSKKKNNKNKSNKTINNNLNNKKLDNKNVNLTKKNISPEKQVNDKPINKNNINKSSTESKKVNTKKPVNTKKIDNNKVETKKIEKNKTVDTKKVKKKKYKLKKGVYVVFILIILLCGGLIYKNYYDKEQARLLKIKLDEEKLQEIKSHYNNYVKVDKLTEIYDYVDNNYVKKGSVYPDVELILRDDDINLNTEYFYSTDLDGYIKYDSVLPIDELKTYDKRYLNYIPYNQNVVTNDTFTLMDGEDNIYTFNKSMSFPIIINNYNNRYYVEYNNRLLSIKKEDVKEIVNNNNSTKKNRSYITTLCYHRVYDTNEKCTDPYVCIKKTSFDQEMKYLKDNNYFTLTMEEMYMYLNKNIQIEKGVLVTFDDGFLIKSAIDVLEKYNLNGSVFIMTGSFNDDFSSFDSPNLERHSHTNSLHKNYVCSGGTQGGAILCYKEQTILDDLNLSRKKLDNPIAMAFPFYDQNDRAINLVKKAGFKMAFVGRAGVMGKAYLGKVNMYKIPRMTVWEQSLMSFNTWKGYL